MKLNKYNIEEKKYLKKHLSKFCSITKIGSVMCFILIGFFSFSLIGKLPSNSNLFSIDKLAHILAYTVLSLCIFLTQALIILERDIENDKLIEIRWGLKPAIFAFLIGVPLGIVIEVIQGKVGRSFDLLDWRADIIGIVLGCIVAAIIIKLVIFRGLLKYKATNLSN
jgi:hypothetical protein